MRLACVIGKNVFLKCADDTREIARLFRRRQEKPRVQLRTWNCRNHRLIADVRVMLGHQVSNLAAKRLHCFKIEIEWGSAQLILLDAEWNREFAVIPGILYHSARTLRDNNEGEFLDRLWQC